MNLKMFKLINGDVVIGDVVMDESEELLVKKPMSLILDPMQGGIGMLPYDAIYTQEECQEFTFNGDHIMYFMKLHSTIEDAYISQTTGIQLSPDITSDEDATKLEQEINTKLDITV